MPKGIRRPPGSVGCKVCAEKGYRVEIYTDWVPDPERPGKKKKMRRERHPNCTVCDGKGYTIPG